MISPLTLLPPTKSPGPGEASGALWRVAGSLSWPRRCVSSCLAFGGTSLYFLCVLMAAGELGAPLLPGHPVTASSFLLALGRHLGLLRPPVAVQMTPGRHRDGFSVTAWSLQGYGNVPGWPSCQAIAGRWLSKAILTPALPCRHSLTAARPRPSALPLL